MTVEDPFAHLHDEGYHDAVSTSWVGWPSLLQRGGRDGVSLSGRWRATLDPFDEGLRQRWYALDESDPATWATPRDYDPGGATEVTVPGCWNLARTEWRHYEGAVWFECEVEIDPTPGQRSLLWFGAAAETARVFLNGQFLGAHRGASTPFAVDATDAAKPGSNRLMVQVSNQRRADGVPMAHFDWFNYGGLHREVRLLSVPDLHIRRCHLWLLPDRDGIRVEITLSQAVDAAVNVHIAGLGIRLAVPITAGRGVQDIAAAPSLWSPEAPTLYEVEARLGADIWVDRIGFRRIATRGTEIVLNGAPIRLKGVCVHEDDRDLGRVTTLEDIERRFRHLKELGGNFLRLAHYPHDERVAALADAHGILLWAEIPVYWAIDFANPTTYADAENQMLELVARDANRCSIVLWGIANETADTDARLLFLSNLAASVRALDPSRLITAACLIDRVRFEIADRLIAVLDVIGVNEYFGWYEPNLQDLDRLLTNSTPAKPVLISETGADAVAGFRDQAALLFSEDRQAVFIADQLERLKRCPYIQGLAVWLLYDFRSERRQTRFQQGWNRKGLVAEDKTTKKLSFETLRQAWAGW